MAIERRAALSANTRYRVASPRESGGFGEPIKYQAPNRATSASRRVHRLGEMTGQRDRLARGFPLNCCTTALPRRARPFGRAHKGHPLLGGNWPTSTPCTAWVGAWGVLGPCVRKAYVFSPNHPMRQRSVRHLIAPTQSIQSPPIAVKGEKIASFLVAYDLCDPMFDA